MALPLLLAGPILRRVEPSLASVWLALSVECDVQLKVWDGLGTSDRPNPFAVSPETRTVRVGAQLHVVVVTIKFEPPSAKAFQADNLYSYDVAIRDATGTRPHARNLAHAGGRRVRRLRPAAARVPERAMLPSFAPPPSKLEDLNLLYGSCRLPGHTTPDALALVDDLISGPENDNRWQSATKRPHQLFLGGDQVYADDLERLQLLMVAQAAVPLIGNIGTDEKPVPVEHLSVDTVAKLVTRSSSQSDTPWLGYKLVDR